MATVYEKERELARDISERVEESLTGVEVLAVELLGPDRLCVYIDHPSGVDHSLCERVTGLLETYRREYGIDVSSPGLERPLRKPKHFARVVGRRVALKTENEIDGRKRFRGELVTADDETVRVSLDGERRVAIPYDEIVRGNLIDER